MAIVATLEPGAGCDALTDHSPMNYHPLRFVLVFSAALATALSVFAQSTGDGTGTVTGRVYDPAAKEYVRNAEVRVQGTEISANTEAGGYFRLLRVPAGKANVVVSFTGYRTVAAEVTVPAGGTVTREIEIYSGLASAGAGDDQVVMLEAFTVETDRTGNAKALQSQRASMNLSRSISSDAFGDVTEGNVGEFLKYLPGVELEYVEADTRGPRLGGMGSEYTSVTLDGRSIASADAFTQYVAFENSAAGTSNRSFGFDAISINSIESIEINRVISAAMDANAPAGNINMKTKRAFDLKGRFVAFNVGTVMNTEEMTLGRTAGPNDGFGRKYKLNYDFSYSDVLFGGRLGVLLGVSESNLYNEQYRVDHTYNRTPTASDPRPQVLTQVLLKDGPKWTERFTTTFTADFRATDNLTLSLNVIFNAYDARFYNRQVTMQAGTNNTNATTGRQFVAGDGLLTYGTTTGGTPASRQVVFGGGNGLKFTNTITIAPSFEYRWNDLTIDGAFQLSHSRNDYDNLAHGSVANSTVNNLQNVGFTATRSSIEDADWKITQTSGPDWTNLANMTNPRISDDNRQATTDLNIGALNVRYQLPTALPTFLQAGVKVTEDSRIARNSNSYDVWSYVGPGGGPTGSFANYPSPIRLYGPGNQVGVKFASIGGGGAPAFPDRDALGRLFNTNPEYFVRGESLGIISTTQYEQGRYLNNPTYDMSETVSAGYLMGNTKIEKLHLQGGVRYERTELESLDWNPYTSSEVAAAGFPVNASGVPTTWAGVDYRYSRPKITRKNNYADFFPSLTAKYLFAPNLLGDIGWGKTIKRPDLSKLAGTTLINDVAETVTTPNTNLRPERSQKLAASLSYFFGRNSSSNVQVVASHTKVRDLQEGETLSAAEYGNTDPAYDSYDFISFSNAGAPVTFRSMEYSYLQYLSFLPKFLQGTSLNLSYTRTYASRRVTGVVPHAIKGGLSYRYKRFTLRFNGVFRDDSPWFQSSSNRYLKSNLKFDLSGSVKLTQNFSLYFSGRNIFEEPHRIFETSAGNPDVLWRYENYGTNWSFGIKGSF